MDGIPDKALKITYQYGSAVGYIYVWQTGLGFQWSALGNNGEGRTFNEAVEFARRWIKDNTSTT